ncbi:SET domain-containing protein [Lophiostoma macrostomum CBS 122681]|uniref:SET domain-containing protein n=1 Tax=Lophiostoma macrostomum CBS 122681 TaxID=1314788 RepID=A0A6A6TJA5_9PLEO|nr:SET domain-containing protein [Lophiostoma macrostomum CBS 122681]
MTSDRGRESQIAELLSWFTENGGLLNDSVRILHDEERGFHARALKRLDPKDVVAECPLSLALSHLNLDHTQASVPHFNSPLQKCLGMIPNDVLSYLLLIEQLVLEDASPWRHYIACLPDQDELTTPLWFTREERRLLEGTDLLHDTQKLEAQLLDEWKVARNAMDKAGMRDSEIYQECDFKTFLWAFTMISSRSFPSRHLIPDRPSFPILFPVIDILNHSPETGVEWDFTTGQSFSLKVLYPTTPGSEVYNNYGPKQNQEFLLEYGFAIPNNPVEQILMRGTIDPQVLEDLREEQIHFEMDVSYIKGPQSRPPHYIRTTGHPFGRYANSIPCFRGFPPYHVLANYLIALRARGIALDDVPPGPTTGRLVLATLLGLYRAVQVKCSQLATRSSDQQLGNAKQSHAYIYRTGQAALCHAIRKELEAVLDSLRVAVPEVGTLGQAAIFTIPDALDALKAEFPLYYDQFTKGKHNSEEETWVLLLGAFAAISLTPQPSHQPREPTLIHRYMQDLYTFYPLPLPETTDSSHSTSTPLSSLTGLFTSLTHSLPTLFEPLTGMHDQILTWATNVVDCESFVLPDAQEPGKTRVCMYLRAWKASSTDEDGDKNGTRTGTGNER